VAQAVRRDVVVRFVVGVRKEYPLMWISDRGRGVAPPEFSGRLIGEGACTVAMLLSSTTINTALPPLLFHPPSIGEYYIYPPPRLTLPTLE
jgi:hypothetical protein